MVVTYRVFSASFIKMVFFFSSVIVFHSSFCCLEIIFVIMFSLQNDIKDVIESHL